MARLDGFYVIAVREGLHWGNAQDFRERVTLELEAGRVRLLIDLRGTGRVDSTGLGALLWAHTRAHSGGGELRLANVEEDLKTRVERLKTIEMVQGA